MNREEREKFQADHFVHLKKDSEQDGGIYWELMDIIEHLDNKVELIRAGYPLKLIWARNKTKRDPLGKGHWQNFRLSKPIAVLRVDGKLTNLRYVGPRDGWCFTKFPAWSVEHFPANRTVFIPRNTPNELKIANNVVHEGRFYRSKSYGWEEFFLQVKSVTKTQGHAYVEVVAGPKQIGTLWKVRSKQLIPLTQQEEDQLIALLAKRVLEKRMRERKELEDE